MLTSEVGRRLDGCDALISRPRLRIRVEYILDEVLCIDRRLVGEDQRMRLVVHRYLLCRFITSKGAMRYVLLSSQSFSHSVIQ